VNLLSAVRTALVAVRRNKLRSALAALGVIIAVAAVVATVALGEGAKAKVAQQMAALGTNMVHVSPGAMSTKGASTGAGGVQTLTLEDGRAIEEELADRVVAAAPLNKIGAQVVYGDANWFTQIVGTTRGYLDVREWPLSAGEAFGREEALAGAKVCLIGATVKERLFGEASAVGEVVRVKRLPCRVVGVLAVKGQGSGGQDQDDIVVMPWATLARRIQGVQGDVVGQLIVGARTSGQVKSLIHDVTALLRQRHRIPDGQENDFHVKNYAEIQASANAQTETVSLLLGGVALISLVVGAIGIANVMLVSVTERTREIGVRIALGARGRDVLLQFLTESVVLAASGGLAGLVVGVACAELMALKAGWPMLLSPAVMASAVVLAGLSGVAAGFYPALRASRLDPIDALRFE
jgi:putative ABC transport system permease protein